MDEFFIVFGLVSLFVFIGSILGWVAFFRIRSLRENNDQLQEEINTLKSLVSLSNRPSSISTSESLATNLADSELATDKPEGQDAKPKQDVNWYKQLQGDEPDKNLEPIKANDDDISLEISIDDIDTKAEANTAAWNSSVDSGQSRPNKKDSEISFFEKLFASASTHWMIWVGGASIGFAGIFLVKYSVDNNLLGPQARILLALLVGVLFHIGAYKLHRLKGPHDAFAALAGGASLILYSALLAALHLYQLLSPTWVFGLLFAVSLATMLLALMYGPVLAAIGILGAYLIPIFVSTGSNNLVGALMYSFIVTVSALLLIRYVSRQWLWLGTLAGAGLWWLLSLSSGLADIARLLYLVALAYTVVAIYQWDWRLLGNRDEHQAASKLSLWQLFKGDCIRADGSYKHSIYFVLLIVLLASIVSIWTVSLSFDLSWLIILVPLLMLWLAFNHYNFLPLAWLSLFAVVSGLLLQSLFFNQPFVLQTWPVSEHQTNLFLLLVLALMFSVTAYFAMKTSDQKFYWSSLGFIAPLVFLTLGFVLTQGTTTNWQWALVAGVIGAVYFNILYRKRTIGLSPEIHAILIIAGHLAYSLAVVMVAREATLTLALAVQVVSLVWVDRYFRLPILPYLIKGILAIIIFRLTFNPWLLTYAIDTHWSLWTYGGSLVCCIAASFLLKDRDDLMRWLRAVALHLFVLTVVAETRYQLYGGFIFIEQYSFFEAAFYTLILGVTGLVYKVRARFAASLARLYERLSTILLLISLANYTLFLLFLKNPLFVFDTVSSTVLWNILLLAYGAPCLIAAGAMYLDKSKQWQRVSGVIAALSVLIFVSIEVRHIWHGELDISQPVLAGELYTYSMVWLALAIIGSLLSVRYRSRELYRASMVFLMVVVGKIFLIDTAGLSSLWRVASFLGLGLSLLGLSYFHQKMGAEFTEETTQNSGDGESDNQTDSVDKAE